MNSQRAQFISLLPSLEYGRALMDWIKEEIDQLEKLEEAGLKICEDPLSEDFRYKLGMKAAFKRVLNKPQECTNILTNKR